jgi:hypothetical protein
MVIGKIQGSSMGFLFVGLACALGFLLLSLGISGGNIVLICTGLVIALAAQGIGIKVFLLRTDSLPTIGCE